MNRRGFLRSMIRAGVGAMVLPSAVTYSRVWRPKPIVVPDIRWIEIIPPTFDYAAYHKAWMEWLNAVENGMLIASIDLESLGYAGQKPHRG